MEVDRSTWSPDPVFRVLADLGGLALADTEGTWNLGVGMFAVVAPDSASAVTRALEAAGMPAWVAGRVTVGDRDLDGFEQGAKGVDGGAVRLGLRVGPVDAVLRGRAEEAGLEMVSLIAEIPVYLFAKNPASIEAVSRRLAKILQLPLDLDELRSESTQWELQVSREVDENDELAEQVREYEEAYDNELLRLESGEDR